MTLAAYTMRALPAQLSGLMAIALDLQWSWHHGCDQLWRQLDEEIWEATHNAWLVLNSASAERLQQLAEDPEFLTRYQQQLNRHEAFNQCPTWYSENCGNQLATGVAWFCMEYGGVSESLPLYSGGLGVLAGGDFLKASSDLGVPVTAVGLLYQQGYFRQALNAEGGEQLEFHPPYNDPTMLPVTPLRDSNGEWARVNVPFPGRTVRLRAWKGQVGGRCELLLLDSNDPPRNEPATGGVLPASSTAAIRKNACNRKWCLELAAGACWHNWGGANLLCATLTKATAHWRWLSARCTGNSRMRPVLKWRGWQPEHQPFYHPHFSSCWF